MATNHNHLDKPMETIKEEGKKQSSTSKLTELEYDTVLVGVSICLGIVYLYLAMAMFHGSYFLFLLDSPDARESWWVHTLAWVWRHGIVVLIASFLLGWDLSVKDDRAKGLVILVLTFPLWIIVVLLFTLFVDAFDMFVIHAQEWKANMPWRWRPRKDIFAARGVKERKLWSSLALYFKHR